ncbi:MULTISPECIES: alpha/beta hydrolase [unclassified Streptomyces]|uniref:alpha/beta fold hydrolase n=1 Tax=unclassified Streptomyces TaxID=2593676 RepID=UPI0033BBD985
MRHLRRLATPKSAALLAVAVLLGLTTTDLTQQRANAAPARPAAAAARSAAVHEQIPTGFSEHKVRAGGVGIDYVIGGHGPTLVLLHGYPQTWYEWRHIMPALAEHYTVIAPDLPGAGRSDAPTTGYDKKSMAAVVHALLVRLGKDRDVRIVGHDIGSMVAYSYAAAHPADVVKLVLSEAPIPDPSLYTFPSLTAGGSGAWHFGFFALPNGMPEALIRGREGVWTDKFIDALEVHKGSVSPDEVAVFAGHLAKPGHLAATLAWFRTLPQDIADDAVAKKTKLTMPVLAIGADGSLGSFVPDQVKQYATDVTGAVIHDSGHWIYEEHPAETTSLLLTFLKGRS